MLSRLEATVGVGVGNDLSTLLNWGDDRLDSLSGKLLVSSEAEVLVIKVLVDYTNHAILAVVSHLLSTVVPDGLGVLNHNLEDIRSLALLGREVEAGEETAAVGERLAGLTEAGLCDGVVLGEEVPLDNVADFSDDVVGIESKTTEAGVDGVGYSGKSDGLVGC